MKDWALAIAKRSNLRKARIALARRLAIIMHAMLRHGTEFQTGIADQHRVRQEAETSSQAGATPRGRERMISRPP